MFSRRISFQPNKNSLRPLSTWWHAHARRISQWTAESIWIVWTPAGSTMRIRCPQPNELLRATTSRHPSMKSMRLLALWILSWLEWGPRWVDPKSAEPWRVVWRMARVHLGVGSWRITCRVSLGGGVHTVGVTFLSYFDLLFVGEFLLKFNLAPGFLKAIPCHTESS